MSEKMTLEELKESNPGLYENFMNTAEREWEIKMADVWAKKIMGAKQEVSTDLRSEFATKLENAIADARKEIEDSVRERLMNDPTIGASKKALEEVKATLRPFVIPEDVEAVVQEVEARSEELRKQLSEKDLEMANLVAENDKLANIAREAGYRYHLEQKLHEVSEHAELIRNLIGDVTKFSSPEELDKRVNGIVEEIRREQEKASVQDERFQKLEEELATQKLIAEKAMEAAQALASQVYVEQRLKNHPDPEYARQLIEGREPESKEQIDKLLEVSIRTPVLNEDLDATRARVRAMVGSSTKEYLQESEESRPRNGQNGAGHDYNGLGMDVGDIRALSGLPENPSN